MVYEDHMRSRGLHPLSTQYAVLFREIQETEPIGKTYDVEWWGPYFIPRVSFYGKDSVVSTLRGVEIHPCLLKPRVRS
jgi:hypothetical protein